jgi:Superinfection immunity protein
VEIAGAFLREILLLAASVASKLFLLPAIIALCRPALGRRNRVAIVLGNFVFGWFLIAWYVLLAWAMIGAEHDVIPEQRSLPG